MLTLFDFRQLLGISVVFDKPCKNKRISNSSKCGVPVTVSDTDGLTENAGREIGGPSKLQGMKLQDMKLTDQCAGHEIAGRENDGPICRT